MADLFSIFASVFMAELGDKTQLATVLFAGTMTRNPLLIFVAAGSALVVSTGLAVAIGQAAHLYLNAVPLKLIAGLAFILMGAFMVLQHFRAV